MAKKEAKQEEKTEEKKSTRIPKVKISQKYVMIICGVIIVLAVAGYICIGIMYNDEKEKQDELETELEAAKIEWARVEGREEKDLTQILKETREALAEEKRLFPVEKSANDLMQILLEAAEESRVNILPLAGIAPATTEKIEGEEYYKVNFRLNPRGTLPNVLDFIERLEHGNIGSNQYATMVVTTLTINGQGSSWSASLSGSLYSRIGSEESTTEETNTSTG